MAEERLHKALARAGVASRRNCETLITEGRVKVNGEVVQSLGSRVDLTVDEVLIDDQPLELPDECVYILLHKPVGVVSTVDDPQGRKTVVDLVNIQTRVFPVGRLDADSEGLLLLTNDGALTHRLTHPRFEVEKEYHAQLDHQPDPTSLRAWQDGVLLDGKPTAPAQVEALKHGSSKGKGFWVRITLREGRKRQIREVARLLGYRVQRLIRVREGALQLGTLPAGQWRNLTPQEIEALQRHSQMADLDESADTQPDANRQPHPAARPPARKKPAPDRAWHEREQARDQMRKERYSRRVSNSRGGGQRNDQKERGYPQGRTRPAQRPKPPRDNSRRQD